MQKRARKGPKRKPAKEPIIDDDLRRIAEMLDEHRTETNAVGWFSLPWKNGECAMRLALVVYQRETLSSVSIPTALSEAAADLWNVGFGIGGLTYEDLDDYRYKLPISHHLSPFIHAAIRCRQLQLSKSDGGGHVYNDVLFPKIGGLVTEDDMITWRAKDALMPPGDLWRTSQAWERARKTFELAWKRGLYHAAYAIKPIGG